MDIDFESDAETPVRTPSWAPSPEQHQRWLDDQAVFRMPPRPLGPASTPPVARSIRPSKSSTWELDFIVGAAAVGLCVAGAVSAVLFVRLQDAKTTAELPPPVAMRLMDGPRSAQRGPTLRARKKSADGPERSAEQPVGAPMASQPLAPPKSAPVPPPAQPEQRAEAPNVVASRAEQPPARPPADDNEAVAKPEAGPPTDAEETPGEFNRDAARSAMFAAAAAAAGCGSSTGPSKRARVTVVMAPSGKVASVSVGAPFAGTKIGHCAARLFRSVTLPAFTGGAVTLNKSFGARVAGDADTKPPNDNTKKSPRKKKRKRRKRGKHRVDLS